MSIDIVGFLARAEDLWSAATKQVSSAPEISLIKLDQGQSLFRVTLDLIQNKSMNLFNML